MKKSVSMFLLLMISVMLVGCDASAVNEPPQVMPAPTPEASLPTPEPLPVETPEPIPAATPETTPPTEPEPTPEPEPDPMESALFELFPDEEFVHIGYADWSGHMFSRVRDGALFAHCGEQHTFPELNEVTHGELVDPGAILRQEWEQAMIFHESRMEVGGYPLDDTLWLPNFDDFLRAYRSNMQLRGRWDDFAQLQFRDWRDSHFAWDNGVVAVGVHTVWEGDTPTEFVVTAWFVMERDETGSPHWERFELLRSTDGLLIDYDGFLIGGLTFIAPDFASDLWDIMAMLDTATTTAEIEAVQRAFGQ